MDALDIRANEIIDDGNPYGDYDEIIEELKDEDYSDEKISYIVRKVEDYFDRVAGHY